MTAANYGVRGKAQRQRGKSRMPWRRIVRQAQAMRGRSIRIGRIAGIPVTVNPWWLLVVALFTWTLGSGYYPYEVAHIKPLASYALGLASILLLFASVLAHEFGHALVARRRGIEVEEIELWPLGGLSKMKGQPRRPQDELAYAAAGPAVTLVIAAIFGVVALVLPRSAPAALRALINYEAEVNAMIFVLNALPAFPLDGGRVARALLWWRRGDMASATRTAAGIGRGFGYAMVALGILLVLEERLAFEGLWLVLIGMFIAAAGTAEQRQEEVVEAFTGVRAAELMSHPAFSVDANMAAVEAGREFASHHYSAFPVVDRSGRAIGVLTIGAVERAPRSHLAQTKVAQLADRDPALLVREDEDVSHLLNEPEFQRIGRAVVIDPDGHPVGLLSVTDIQRALRAKQLAA
jgi:Zn-dependent protease/CBS domain-containing protein